MCVLAFQHICSHSFHNRIFIEITLDSQVASINRYRKRRKLRLLFNKNVLPHNMVDKRKKKERKKESKSDLNILENIESRHHLKSSCFGGASQASPIDLASLICEVQFNVVEGRIISSKILHWMRFIAYIMLLFLKNVKI